MTSLTNEKGLPQGLHISVLDRLHQDNIEERVEHYSDGQITYVFPADPGERLEYDFSFLAVHLPTGGSLNRDPVIIRVGQERYALYKQKPSHFHRG